MTWFVLLSYLVYNRFISAYILKLDSKTLPITTCLTFLLCGYYKYCLTPLTFDMFICYIVYIEQLMFSKY